ncbi:MAG: PqqD family protein [candidate division WOR-3 bacterium]|nr:PqqD family protein [candidate division WOR-3 bacterium]
MKRKDNFVMQEVGGENLLVPIGSQVMDMNGLVILNDTARCVWELLAQDRSADELAAAVVERFDVTPDRARADVQTFLDEITRMGMVKQ